MRKTLAIVFFVILTISLSLFKVNAAENNIYYEIQEGEIGSVINLGLDDGEQVAEEVQVLQQETADAGIEEDSSNEEMYFEVFPTEGELLVDDEIAEDAVNEVEENINSVVGLYAGVENDDLILNDDTDDMILDEVILEDVIEGSSGTGEKEVSFAGGDGTENSPYQIETAEQLNSIRNDMSAYYTLTQDIDISQYSNWQPIGDRENTFEGVLNGAGHSINNLTIKSEELEYAGLFGACNNAQIKNITLTNVSILIDKEKEEYVDGRATTYVGGIAAYYASISNCNVYGSISVINCCHAKVGGIVGGMINAENCINYVDIYVLSNKGNDRFSSYAGTVECGGIGAYGLNLTNCRNYGDITVNSGNFLYCGGICGHQGNINYCINYGNITGLTGSAWCFSTFAGRCNVGGIVGATWEYVEFSINYGNISSYTCDWGDGYAGGIAGYCGYYGMGSLKHCYNMAQIISSKRQGTDQSGSVMIEYAAAGRIAGATRVSLEGYSINTTHVNGEIPINDLGKDKKNGAALDENLMIDVINGKYATDDKIIRLNPENGEKDVNPKLYGEGYDIEVCFEDVVTKNTGNIVVRNIDQGVDIATYSVTSEDVAVRENVLIINSVLLPYETNVAVVFDTGCVSVGGNVFLGLTEENDWSFTTGKIISRTFPENNFYGLPCSGLDGNLLSIQFSKKLDENVPLGEGSICFWDKATGKLILQITKNTESKFSLMGDDYKIGISICKKDAFPYDRDIYVTLSDDVVRFEDGTCNEECKDPDMWCFHTFPVDVPAVTNSSVSKRIDEEKYDKFFKGNTKLAVQEEITGLDGVCFGMCYAAIAWKNNYNTIHDVIKEESLFQTDVMAKGLGDISLLDYFQYAHIFQKTSKIQWSKVTSITSIRNKILDYLNNNGNPVIINVKNKDKGIKDGHAVLPVGIVTDNSEYSRFLLYNCNEPAKCYYLDIYKSTLGQWNDWEIVRFDLLEEDPYTTVYSSVNHKLWINILDETCDTSIGNGNGYYYREEENLFVTRMDSFIINGSEIYENDTDGDTLSLIRAVAGDEADINSEFKLYWTKENNLRIDSGNEIFQETMFISQDYGYSISVDVPAEVSVSLEEDEVVRINLQEEGSIIFSKDIMIGSAEEIFTISGKTDTETVSVMETDTGFSIKGMNSLQIVNQQADSYFSLSLSGLDNKTDYQITTKNGISVGEDSDGDGIADKIIATSTENILKAQINVSDQYYTGTVVIPETEVYFNGQQLTKDIDYTVSYRNNVNIGTATIVITGKGRYTGTKTITFKIIEKEHIWGSWTVTKKATCTTSGLSERKCSICGKTEKKTLPATGHKWSNWTIASKATVFAAEQQKRTCSVCGYSETRNVGSKLAPVLEIPGKLSSLSIKQSKTVKFALTMANGDSLTSVKSSNTKYVKVSSYDKKTGTVSLKAMKKGSAKVTIKLASGKTRTYTVKVTTGTVKTTKVTLSSTKVTLDKGKTQTLKPVLTPFTSTQKITYKSSNKKVATVTSAGKIKTVAPGTATITVTSGSKKATCKVTVIGIGNVKSSVSVKKSKTLTLKPKLYGISGKVTYTSSNTKIATVDANGKIKGIKKGKATITVKVGNKQVTCKVTVK